MTKREIILLAIIAGLLLWLFVRSEPEKGATFNYYIDSTLTFPEQGYTIIQPEPVRVEVLQQSIPVGQIPDSLIRQLYAELAAKYDSLNKTRTYHETVNDSFITGEMTAITTGKLDRIDLKYKIKDIRFTDTLRIENKPHRFELFGNAGINSQFQPQIGLTATKGKYLFGADYQPINQVIAVKAGIRLFRIKGK